MRRWAGLVLLGLVAVFTAVSPYAADWNETHIHNPYWPPHAKFHNAQTMVFGASAGVLALVFLALSSASRTHLRVGALFAGLYWFTQMPAILFPGTAFTDPQVQGLPPLVVLGHTTNQVELDVLVLGLVALGYSLARRAP